METSVFPIDKAAELARMSASNFFIDLPAGVSKAAYLYHIANHEANRFGPTDQLALHYSTLAAYCLRVGA